MSLIGAVLEGIFEGLFVEVLGPMILAIVRFPGAVLGWFLWRGRSFSRVWKNGDRFGQGMAGVFIYALIIALVLFLYKG